MSITLCYLNHPTMPLAAEAAGMSFEDLVETILEAALRTEAAKL